MIERDFYILKDGGDNSCGAIRVDDVEELQKYNDDGYGIYWTVNSFTDGIRRESNLKRLNSFYVDIDMGTKESILEKFKYTMGPSRLIETKNGFHAYWDIEDDMIAEMGKEKAINLYKQIMKFRIIPFFKGDRNAADVSRILRVPFFLHQKNPDDKFEIRDHEVNNPGYTWRMIEKAFPWEIKPMKTDRLKASLKKDYKFVSDSIWEKIWELDSMDALIRLSGAKYVGGEVFSFNRTSSGNHNILVNGKGTSCWVDSEGKIGSHQNGGPTITQWLKWYNHSYRDVINIIKEIYPEIK